MPDDADRADWDSPDFDGDDAEGMDEGPAPEDLVDDDEDDHRRCPACRQWIYADAEKCPECGEWVLPDTRVAGPWRWLALFVAAVLIGWLILPLL